MSSEKKGRKIGSNSRRSAAWWKDGGPLRSAIRKARHHGCGRHMLHLGEKGMRDRAHSGMQA